MLSLDSKPQCSLNDVIGTVITKESAQECSLSVEILQKHLIYDANAKRNVFRLTELVPML